MHIRSLMTISLMLAVALSLLARVSAEEQALAAASPAFQASETAAIQRTHAYFRAINWPTEGEIVTEVLTYDSEGVPVEWAVYIGNARAYINTSIIRFAL